MAIQSVSFVLKGETILLSSTGLLLHQQETLDALAHHPVVLNCAMTGAGKTRASHLGIQTYASGQNVLYIAPTNALVQQHESDAKAFVLKHGLSHHVISITGEVLTQIRATSNGIYRNSEALHQVIQNPRSFDHIFKLGDIKAPLWMITNPDLVWRSMIDHRSHDSRNLMIDFVNRFRFVVVDEFHYYTAEQLILFLLCMALWKHFNQFTYGLKLLLLTATPEPMITEFFDRMAIPYCCVGLSKPTSSPIENCTPALAPIQLTLSTGQLSDYHSFISNEYHNQNDGVIISDSLFDINKLYNTYHDLGFSVGRITGVINSQQRKIESQKRLILATPTVDLGYNFIKPVPKDRQEIDFIVSTSYEKSKFWQRLGRAGRVLGRKQTNCFSKAIMLFKTPAAFNSVLQFHDQELTRNELADLLRLENKRMKMKALTREGLFVASRQLRDIKKMLSDDHSHVVESIFQTLKACFDPHDKTPQWASVEKRHWVCDQIVSAKKQYPHLSTSHIHHFLTQEINKLSNPLQHPLMITIYSWLKHYYYQSGQYEDFLNIAETNHVIPFAIQLLNKKPSLYQTIVAYFNEQHLRMHYLFNFRGGEQTGYDVWVFDPNGLHSEDQITQIELVSLISRYHFSKVLPHNLAEKEWQVRLPKQKQWVRIEAFQDFPVKPVFRYNGTILDHLAKEKIPHDEHADMAILPVFWRTMMLEKIELDFQNKRSIPIEFKPYVSNYCDMFFITPMDQYTLVQWLKDYQFFSGKLVDLTQTYSVIYGKDAILMSEELYYQKQCIKESSC